METSLLLRVNKANCFQRGAGIVLRYYMLSIIYRFFFSLGLLEVRNLEVFRSVVERSELQKCLFRSQNLFGTPQPQI